MPLLVPKYLTQAFQPKHMDRAAGFYYCMQHLAGTFCKLPELLRELTPLRRSDVIRWIASIHSLITIHGHGNMQLQRRLGQQLLDHDTWKALENKIIKQGKNAGIIFHDRQLWLLLQFVLLACSESSEALSAEAQLKAVGKCCLLASDVLHQIEEVKQPSSPGESSPEWFAQVFVPIMQVHAGYELIVRSKMFWLELPDTPELKEQAAKHQIGTLEAAFEAKYGLPLREFWLIVLSTFAAFEAKVHQNQLSPLLLDPASDGHLQKLFGSEDLRKSFSLLSQSADNLSIGMLAEPRQGWAFDFTPLRKYPIIEVFPGKYTCPDIDMFKRFLTDGILFLLQEAYPDDRFRAYFGHLFAAYVHRLIREFAPESSILVRRFYASLAFSPDGGEACDGALVYPKLALITEVKGALLTTKEKYSGDMEDVLKGILSRFGSGKKGIGQLATSFKRILNGDIVRDETGTPLDLSSVPLLVPTLICYEEVMGINSVQLILERLFREELGTVKEHPRIGPLLVLTVTDMEVLEDMATHYSVEQIMLDYIQAVRDHPNAALLSFNTFAGQYYRRKVDQHSFIKTKRHTILKETEDEMAARLAESGAHASKKLTA